MDSHIKSSSSRMLVDSGEKFQSAIPSFKALGEEEEEDSTRQPPIQWVGKWLRRYKFWIMISKKKPVFQLPSQFEISISQIEKQSIDLKVSLQMLLHDATIFVKHWTDVNTQFSDRSFGTFLFMLQTSGLDWHKYKCVQQEFDLESIAQANHTRPTHAVCAQTNWVIANKYYCRSLALIRLLLRIRESKSFDESKKHQASMLLSFLGHLIMIQQEQRVVVKTISEHLEQLKRLSSGLTMQNKLSQHPTHPHDSLYVISCESTCLLKKLKDSPLASHSFIDESEKIVNTLEEFIPEYNKESKENKGILIQQFGNHIKCLQEEGVGKGTVIETLLGCLEHVCNVSMTRYPFDETGKLVFPWYEVSPLLGCGGGSPLGCITLWRILFESAAAGLGNYYEAVELEAIRREEPLQIGVEIDSILSDWEKLLHDFVDMHKTVAEITYMLGDAYTTGGAGMNSLHNEAPSQSKKSDEESEMDMVSDFPWDNHKVYAPTRFEDPSIRLSHPMWGPSVSDPVPEAHHMDKFRRIRRQLHGQV